MVINQSQKSSSIVTQIASQIRSADDSWAKTISAEDLQQLKTATDEDGRSLLHTIAAVGRIDLLQHIQQHGFMEAVNSADSEGWTPLLSAASAGHEGAVQILLGHGADVGARTKGGRSALHYAASKGHVRVAQVLLEAGIAVNSWQWNVHVLEGCGVRHLGKRALIVTAYGYVGADVGVTDVHKSTPLHRACSACKEVMVEVLLDAGADIAAIDAKGDTPLHVAIECAQERQSAQAAFLLASKGAPLHVKNADGHTPLLLAGENASSLQAAADAGA